MWTHHSSIDSDLSDLTQVEEIIREKILLRSNKEVPYSVSQENVGWKEDNGVVSIVQNISVDRVGQKVGAFSLHSLFLLLLLLHPLSDPLRLPTPTVFQDHSLGAKGREHPVDP